MRESEDMRKNILKTIMKVGMVSAALFFFGVGTAYAIRIKDISTIAGVRDNQLVGYGLVIGLAGTGDKAGTRFTMQSLANMLTRMGITADSEKIKVKNVAAVMVTANLPPFAIPGTRLDINLASLGDAKTLQGGTLLMTPLKGPDQMVYAVAQGEISVGGFIGGEEGNTVQKNHPTAARIANGAIVERAVGTDFLKKENITLTMNYADFTTATRMADLINTNLRDVAAQIGEEGRPPFARAENNRTVALEVPALYRGRLPELITRIERLDLEIDLPAKVVVHERTGTIVMGSQVKILDVAIAHGNLTIEIKTEKEVSQPGPFSKGTTQSVPKTETVITEKSIPLVVLKGGANLDTLVQGLNALGVTPRDLISILLAIKAAGALQAELEII